MEITKSLSGGLGSAGHKAALQRGTAEGTQSGDCREPGGLLGLGSHASIHCSPVGRSSCLALDLGGEPSRSRAGRRVQAARAELPPARRHFAPRCSCSAAAPCRSSAAVIAPPPALIAQFASITDIRASAVRAHKHARLPHRVRDL